MGSHRYATRFLLWAQEKLGALSGFTCDAYGGYLVLDGSGGPEHYVRLWQEGPVAHGLARVRTLWHRREGGVRIPYRVSVETRFDYRPKWFWTASIPRPKLWWVMLQPPDHQFIYGPDHPSGHNCDHCTRSYEPRRVTVRLTRRGAMRKAQDLNSYSIQAGWFYVEGDPEMVA